MEHERLRSDPRTKEEKAAPEEQPTTFATGTQELPKIESSTVRDEDSALHRIGRNLRFLDNLLQDLLDLSAFDAARFELQYDTTELGGLVAKVVARMVSARERERVHVRCDRGIVVRIDARRITRVIATIVQLALKNAARDARISLVVDECAGRARVGLVVEGVGDPQGMLEKFRRAGSTRRDDGVALALYVGRRIIEAHDGRLGVEGARFYFDLPTA